MKKEKREETQYARLCRAKADAQELENEARRGQLIPRAEQEAKDRADNEVIRSDLGFGLPSSLATALAGRAWTAADVKRIATDQIREMVKRWNSGGITSKQAIP